MPNGTVSVRINVTDIRVERAFSGGAPNSRRFRANWGGGPRPAHSKSLPWLQPVATG